MTVIDLPFYLGAQQGASSRRRYGWISIPVEIEEAEPLHVQHLSTGLRFGPFETSTVDIFSKYLFNDAIYRPAVDLKWNSSGALFNPDGVLSETPLNSLEELEVQRFTDAFCRVMYPKMSGNFYRTMYSGHQRLPSLQGVTDEDLQAVASWAKENLLLCAGRLLTKTTLPSLVVPISGSGYSATVTCAFIGGVHFACPDEDFKRLLQVREDRYVTDRVIKAKIMQRFEEEVGGSDFDFAGNVAFNSKVLERLSSSYLFYARSVASVALDVIEMHEENLAGVPKILRHPGQYLRLLDDLKCDEGDVALIDEIAHAIPRLPMFRYSDRQRKLIDLVLERYHDRPVEDLNKGVSPSARSTSIGMGVPG
jgi:hypothetical protein